MTPLRLLTAEIAAQRLVAKGHLTSRSLSFEPSSSAVSALREGGMRGASVQSAERGGAPTNPLLEADRLASEAVRSRTALPGRVPAGAVSPPGPDDPAV